VLVFAARSLTVPLAALSPTRCIADIFDFQADQVQEWFSNYRGGAWSSFGGKFAGLTGAEMVRVPLDAFKDAMGPVIGPLAYEYWHDFCASLLPW